MDMDNIRAIRAVAAQVAATALSRAPDTHTYQDPPTSDEVIAFAREIESYINRG